MKYVAKYYPLVDGKEKEYTTTVVADDKKTAEQDIRDAFVEQMDRLEYMIKEHNAIVVGYNLEKISRYREYAKSKMRVVIE